MTYDKYISDSKGTPLAAYGPRKVVGAEGDQMVEECPPEEATLWGVYRYNEEGLAAIVGDAQTELDAEAFAKVVASEVERDRTAAADMTDPSTDPIATIKAASERLIASWDAAQEALLQTATDERFIVLDKYGRAYGAPLNGGYHIKLPRLNFDETQLMESRQAQWIANRLAEVNAEYGPYVVHDGVEYARGRVREAAASLRMVEVAPAVPDPEATSMPNPNTFTVTTGSGEFTVSKETGEILSSEVYKGADDEAYFSFLQAHIVRFDVEEYVQWCEHVGLEPAESVDFLCMGYWTEADKFDEEEHYEEAESDYRDDVLEAFSKVVYRFSIDHSGQYRNMLGHLREEGLAPQGRSVIRDGRRELLISIAERHMPALDELRKTQPGRFADPLRTEQRAAAPREWLVVRVAEAAVAAFRDADRMTEIAHIMRKASNRIMEQARVAKTGYRTGMLGRTPYSELTGFLLTDQQGSELCSVTVLGPDVPFEDPTDGATAVYLYLSPYTDKADGLLVVARNLREASSLVASGRSEDVLLGTDGEFVGRVVVSTPGELDLERHTAGEADAGGELTT